MSLAANKLQPMADAIRVLAMDAVQQANSGHPGMPMGMADVATVLYSRFLKFDPAAPRWPDRDRFVLSAGHGSMLLYALLHLSGYAAPTMADIRNFRQLHSPCAGHPENTELAGVECTTGPLGQGLTRPVALSRSAPDCFARNRCATPPYQLSRADGLVRGTLDAVRSICGRTSSASGASRTSAIAIRL